MSEKFMACGFVIQDEHGNYVLQKGADMKSTQHTKAYLVEIAHKLNQYGSLIKSLDLAETYLEDGAPNSALAVIKRALADSKAEGK